MRETAELLADPAALWRRRCRQRPIDLGAVQRLLQFPVFAQFRPVRADLLDRDRARVGPEEHLEQADISQFRQLADGLRR
jgi:hypothetical protein